MSLLNQIHIWLKAYALLFFVVRNNWLIVARYKAIGDVLWVEPVLRQLSQTGRSIIFVTAYPELFENYPLPGISFKSTDQKQFKRVVRLLITFRLSRYLIDLNRSYEKDPQKHFLHAYQQQAGLPFTEEYPQLHLTAKEREAYAHHGKYAVLHLESFSIWNHRQVYGINWQHIIDYLVYTKGYRVFILSKEKPSYKNVEHPVTSIRGAMGIIYNASLFIGIDSGPSHIASCFRIPSILFFGSINPWYRHFKGLLNGVIMQQFCEFAGCYHRLSNKKDDHECLLKEKMSIPKCSVHTEDHLINNIDNLISRLFKKAI